MPGADADSEARDGTGADVNVNAAALFALLWDALAEVLGSAATAAIVRRAAGRAAPESPELVDLVVRREKLEYRYTLPATWSHLASAATTPGERAPAGLRALAAQIGLLLVELTGNVVVGRLEQIPALRMAGLSWRAEGAN
jgi:hypothetical protein